MQKLWGFLIIWNVFFKVNKWFEKIEYNTKLGENRQELTSLEYYITYLIIGKIFEMYFSKYINDLIK